MKYIFVALISIFFWCGKNDPTSDALKPFSVRLWAGDEGSTLYTLKVYKKNGKFYADKTSPNYYYGNNYDSVWTVELDSVKTLACLNFINKAKELSKKCKETFSSYREYLTIIVDTTKIHVGTCYWSCCDYYSLEKDLFSEQFKTLENQRNEIISNLTQTLNGRWYLIPSTHDLKRDDIIILSRQMGSDSTCYWEFSNDYSFKGHCNSFIDLTQSKKYRILTQNKVINLIIAGGSKTEKDGSSSVANYGAWLNVDSISANRIKLRYKWRN